MEADLISRPLFDARNRNDVRKQTSLPVDQSFEIN
jgi:hypothetical protein